MKVDNRSRMLWRACLLLFTGAWLWADTEVAETDDLFDMSLEELMAIEVTTLSRKRQKLSSVAAAVTVITKEDIRRSGATTIPDLLRRVPGVEVAKINSHRHAVTVRGANGQFANKLLVLIDGRSVYTPLFSGVFWEIQDVVLTDIERIEVIRGPGASVWGANAVNGIINIITQHAANTVGGVVSSHVGSEEQSIGLRYGLALDESKFIRFSAKSYDRDSGFSDGLAGNDDWRSSRFNTRYDWQVNERDALTIHGEIYGGSYSSHNIIPTLTAPFSTTTVDDARFSGGSLMLEYRREVSEDYEWALQGYYDHNQLRNELITDYSRHTIDLEFNNRLKLSSRNELTFGVGYRYIGDRTDDRPLSTYDPDHRETHLFSTHMQNETELVEDELTLTLGIKVEHNDYTGVEAQPNARLSWRPTEEQTLWLAYSRAVRTPSRAETDINLLFQGTPFGFVTVRGNEELDSDELHAFELGYRVRPHETLTVDMTTFYNTYDQLRTLDVTGLFVDARNRGRSNTYGAELESHWQARDNLRLYMSYAFFRQQIQLADNSTDVSTEGTEGSSPQHSAALGVQIDLTENLEWDSTIRYVDNLVDTNNTPRYLVADIRLGWRPSDTLEVALIARNLFDRSHPEFSGNQGVVLLIPTEVERSIALNLTYRF